MILRSKKGNAVIDTLMVIVVLLVFGIMLFVGKGVFTSLNDDIQASDDFNNQTKDIVKTQHDKYSNFFDAVFLLVFILLWALVLVASFNVDSHPIFFIFSVILLIAVFMVAGFVSNVYADFSLDPDMSAVTSTFPMTDWIMTHLLIAAIVIGFSVLLVLFGKNRLK